MAGNSPEKDLVVDYDFGPSHPSSVEEAIEEMKERVVEDGLGVFRTQDGVTEMLALLPPQEAQAMAEAGKAASKDTVPPVTYDTGRVAVAAVQSVRVRYERV